MEREGGVFGKADVFPPSCHRREKDPWVCSKGFLCYSLFVIPHNQWNT